MCKWMLGAAPAALAFAASEARANPFRSCTGPFCDHWPASFAGHYSNNGGIGKAGFGAVPVFQAAPWYLYWPYDAHFLTPAPIGGLYYPPPIPGNFPVNPYYPVQPPPYVPESPLNAYPLTAPH
jgi:hypothetical protein